MAKQTIRIDQANKSVAFPETTVVDQLVLKLFDGTPTKERSALYDKVLRTGSYAYLEDRIGAFLATTATTIGAEFEYLKLLFEVREHSMATTEKGTIAEVDIESSMASFIAEHGWNDILENTGAVGGKLDGGSNKTGDLVAHIGGAEGPRLALEVKFDKQIAVGELFDPKHENKRVTDTAWNQLVEAATNRDAGLAMIVLDQGSASAAIKKKVRDVEWLPGGGLAVMVDVANGDFRNLAAAYAFARSLLLALARPELDAELLSVVVSRALREVQRSLQARSHVEAIINSARNLMVDLEQSNAALQSIQEMLSSVDDQHPLGQSELLTLYRGEDVRDARARIEKELENF